MKIKYYSKNQNLSLQNKNYLKVSYKRYVHHESQKREISNNYLKVIFVSENEITIKLSSQKASLVFLSLENKKNVRKTSQNLKSPKVSYLVGKGFNKLGYKLSNLKGIILQVNSTET